jgi:hypothetical protein
VELAVVDATPPAVVQPETPESFRVRDPDFPQRELLVEFVPADMAQLAAGAGAGEVGDGDHALRNAFDGVINSIPKAAVLLEAGNTMRVVGPPHALAGLADGSYELVTSAGKSLGMVRDVGSGQFAAHLRFAKAGITPAAGAMAVFQVMSVMTGQYYLHRIDAKLETIEGGVKALIRNHTADLYGQIEAAARLNEQVRANLLDGIAPNRSDFSDLDHAEQLVLPAYGSLRKTLADFLARVQALNPPDCGKGTLRELWDAAADGEIREEAALLAYAAFVRHQNNLLALGIEPQGDPRRAENIEDRIEAERRQMIDDFKAVKKIYDMLAVSDTKLQEAFRFSGKMVEERTEFRRQTTPLRRIAGRLEERLLPPAPEPDLPFLAEIHRRKDGELEVAAAVLRSHD